MIMEKQGFVSRDESKLKHILESCDYQNPKPRIKTKIGIETSTTSVKNLIGSFLQTRKKGLVES